MAKMIAPSSPARSWAGGIIRTNVIRGESADATDAREASAAAKSSVFARMGVPVDLTLSDGRRRLRASRTDVRESLRRLLLLRCGEIRGHGAHECADPQRREVYEA